MFPPDYARAALIYQLLKDYHDEVAPALKRLRRHVEAQAVLKEPARTWDAVLSTDELERDRVAATGWFNQVFALYSRGLITLDDFALVATPRAAQLWVELVLPLDTAVRVAAHGPDAEGYENPVAAFWTDYAAGQLRVYGPKHSAVN